MKTVTVSLGERSYPIYIGAGTLRELPAAVRGRAFVVTDENVDRLHGETIRRVLPHATVMVVPEGEGSKSFGTLQTMLDAMFAAGMSRSDTVVAFGGGIVGDLAGFAASVYKRGCHLVQVPTTLLAQVDSSVGGKTAINVAQGKNLVGAFYQPQVVIIDTDLLATLPSRQLRSGYAEVVKYGLIGDPDFFLWLDTNATKILAGDREATALAIATSCEAKARVVAADEREGGVRALLNLGHTFAHALELQAGYTGDLLHGEAVSAGLAMAFEFSHRAGHCEADDAARVAGHLRGLDLVRPSGLGALLDDPDALLAAMDQDKKNAGEQLTLILARGIGDAFIDRDADRGAVSDYLHYLKARHALPDTSTELEKN